MQTLTRDLEGLRDQLARDGYVIVEDVFNPAEDFRQLFTDWEEILDGAIDEAVVAGMMTERYVDQPFEERFIQLCANTGADFFRRFDIALRTQKVTTDTKVYLGPGIFNILTNERLLDVVEAFVGPEVSSNPNQHVRLKLPKSVRTAGNYTDGRVGPSHFHQDQGVSLPEADESDILTCWIALTDATEELACLQVFPRTAQEGVLLTHCPDDSPAAKRQGRHGIPPTVLPKEGPTPLPVRAGSAIFFKGQLVHGSFENYSQDRLRMSLDLRFQKTGLPTGRPEFPSFVARSRSHPENELRDWKAWTQLWYDARDRLAMVGGGQPEYFRGDRNSPDCL